MAGSGRRRTAPGSSGFACACCRASLAGMESVHRRKCSSCSLPERVRVPEARARDLGLLAHRRSAGARATRRQRGPARTLHKRTVRSASGWSHIKSLNSSSATSVTASLPCRRRRVSMRAPAWPRMRREEQYRQTESVPGSIQAGESMARGSGWMHWDRWLLYSFNFMQGCNPRVRPKESQMGS